MTAVIKWYMKFCTEFHFFMGPGLASLLATSFEITGKYHTCTIILDVYFYNLFFHIEGRSKRSHVSLNLHCNWLFG